MIYSMCKGIGESQKVDNLTLNCMLNFSEIKIRNFVGLNSFRKQKHP